MEITLGEKVLQEEVFLAAAANARYFGGGMLLAPQAQVGDGFLDLVIIKSLPKRELLWMLPRIFTGKHTSHRAFYTIPFTEAVISGLQKWVIRRKENCRPRRK